MRGLLQIGCEECNEQFWVLNKKLSEISLIWDISIAMTKKLTAQVRTNLRHAETSLGGATSRSRSNIEFLVVTHVQPIGITTNPAESMN